jgi:uncharacterized membrane protein YfcA
MNFIWIIIIASLIVLIGKTVKGLTGFASSPIIVPLLTLFLDIKFVVPVVAVMTFFSGLIMFIMTRKNIKKDEFIFVLIFVIIGSFIGAQILANFDSILLKKIFGVVIILFSLRMFFIVDIKTVKKIKKFWGAVAGFIGGVFGGIFDVNGPPIVIYMGHKLKKESFRATITAIFFVDVIWRNILYMLNGVASFESFKFALFLLPALVVGVLLGSKIHVKINEVLFRRIVAIVLFVTGILLVI